MLEDRSLHGKWDERYQASEPGSGEPARVLRDYAHLLPHRGDALDLACGMGANALFLARRGLVTQAWDISQVAIAKLRAYADTQGLPLQGRVHDAIAQPPAPGTVDVIVIAHFLERDLAGHLVDALRLGGLLFFQTFTRTFVNPAGPSQDIFRLGDNELLGMFPSLRVLAYREEGTVGDTAQGFRDEALLVALKE
jgi:tellurite methyltransferase